MKKRAHEEWSKITNQIKDIDRQYAQGRHPELYKERVEIQTKFDLLLTHRIECQLLKSKSLICVHGDKSGKMVAKQLKGF